MKTLIAIVLISAMAQAETFQVNGNEVTKVEAVKAAMNGQRVFKIQEVVLTDKLTFKAVKKPKTKKD